MRNRSFEAHDAYQELQRHLATERADTPLDEQRKRQNDLAVFNVLRGMLQKSEYDAMLARWHNGGTRNMY
jgi:hypothetical protein